MHSRKRATQPQEHFTPYCKKRPDKYDECPNCNGQKRTVASFCWACMLLLRRPAERPEVFFLEGESCRRIPLTKGYEAIVDADRFDYLSQFPWYSDTRKGTSLRYARRRDKENRVVSMHQEVYGEKFVDHKNGNTLDNRRSNLRKCDPSSNGANAPLSRRNKSGYKGVTWDTARNRWTVGIVVRRHRKFLGRFLSLQEAASAYDEAAVKYFGEFARINHIRD